MPGHLNERTLREFQVNMYRYFNEDIDGLENFVKAMLSRIDELEGRISKLEAKRGPGRPKKVA